MNKTGIEYLDYTWSPTVGCTKLSPGCRSCWAHTMAHRLKAMGNKDYQLDDPFKPRFLSHRLDEPLKVKKPSRIGVSFMGDLFHENISYKFINRILAVIACSPQHSYLILTKRPHRMLSYFGHYMEPPGSYYLYDVAYGMNLVPKNINSFVPLPLKNLWLGVSVEDQKTYDERVSVLIQIPAAKRWVSYEPALEKVYMMTTEIDWLVMGAETGHNARPFEIEWARHTRDQCEFSGIPFFFKSAGKQEIPEDLKIQGYPK